MIPVAEPALGNEELNNVIAAFKSGWISSKGAFIPELEKRFARYCGLRHGVSTFNGTAALHLALTALGIWPGDEVIVPALTFIATANAVAYCGAKPVIVDVHPDYWCIDPRRIEEAITPRTKAPIPVHLYGHPCDMDAIMAIARRHRLLVVEDAAEAHGAECRGRKVGSFGRIGMFSALSTLLNLEMLSMLSIQFRRRLRKRVSMILKLLESDTNKLEDSTMKEAVIKSSGNVYLDLGFPPEEAAILQMRSEIMADLRKFITTKKADSS